MTRKLGIIAGSGALPVMLAQSAERAGWDVFAVCLQGQAQPADYQSFHFESFRIGQGGAMVRALKRRGITDIALIGGIRRPSLLEARPDWWMLRFVLRYGVAALGDDGALKAIRSALEAEDFRLIAVQDFLPELVVPVGAIGTHLPSAEAQADIARGRDVCVAIGALDIGQACVVQQGLVLGVEGIEGTDALIARCAAYRRAGRGPVLVKCAKPGQDNALDLPTIGPSTIENAIASGFSGVAIQSGAALIVDPDAVKALADQHGLFVVGI